jgi:hypothetical protein
MASAALRPGAMDTPAQRKDKESAPESLGEGWPRPHLWRPNRTLRFCFFVTRARVRASAKAHRLLLSAH